MEILLISTISSSENKIFSELTKLAAKYECHISYSHLFALGLNKTITLQITGNWSRVAKVEAALPTLAKRLETEIIFKRSVQEKVDRFYLPYQIDLVAVDQPGLVFEITDFLTSLEMLIQHLEIRSQKHQQTPLLKLHVEVELPADNNIADMREQFLVFCDELNLDGTMEPKK